MMASDLNCIWRQLENGTAEYKLSIPINCANYDWDVNGKAVANDEGETTSAVLSHTPNSLYLKSPSLYVSLKQDCQKPYEVFCNGPISAPPDDMSWIYALCGVLLVLLVLLAVGIGICWWRKKGCFKRSPTPEAQHQEMVRMNNNQACV